MDPITRAARTFQVEADAFWRTGKAGTRSVLPMFAAASARGDLVKALRLAELDLSNRRPLFVHEGPFGETRAWGDGIAAAIAQDYEQVREGAAKEGVRLPPFPAESAGPSEKDPPLARAVWAIERAAALVAEQLDGVLIALLPEAVADPSAYRHAVATLAATCFSPRVRLAVHAYPDGPLAGVLGRDGAHFEVDQAALAEHMKQLGSGRGSEGPPSPPCVEPTDEQRRMYEAETGSRLPSTEAARALRVLLVDAAMATSRSDHQAAAMHYRAARELCQREGLTIEDATVLVALGGACLAAGELDLAVDGFREAAGQAERLEAWPVACQAWLGAGGAHLTAKQYEAAALAYERAAGVAERAGIAILGVEALRMAGTCHLLRGAQPEAMRTWVQALDLGREIAPRERSLSTYPQVAEDLAALLEGRGLHAQAAHVRSLLAEPAPPPDQLPEANKPDLTPGATDCPATAVPKRAPSELAATSLASAVPTGPALPFGPDATPHVASGPRKRAPAALTGTSMALVVPKGPALPFVMPCATVAGLPPPSPPAAPTTREDAPSPPVASPVRRAPAALTGTTMGFIAPKGPALPFGGERPAPNVARWTADLHRTLDGAAPRAEPVMPFDPNAPSSLASAGGGPLPVRSAAELGGTQDGAAPPNGPAMPFAGASEAGAFMGWSIEQYASLCVELAVGSTKEDETLRRYGITLEQRKKLDAYWQGRIGAEAQVWMAFDRAYATYKAWLSGSRG